MDLHAALDLVRASGIVVQAPGEVFWENSLHDHPHALSMNDAFHIDAKDELHDVPFLKTLTGVERWNLERLREFTIQRNAAIERETYGHMEASVCMLGGSKL